MAVRIRMRREGTTNRPYYRIVCADKHSPRDVKVIEQVGTYEPTKKDGGTKLKMDRVDFWVKSGAQPSETVSSVLRKLCKATPAACRGPFGHALLHRIPAPAAHRPSR